MKRFKIPTTLLWIIMVPAVGALLVFRNSPSPAQCYKTEFGSSPSPGVANLKAKQVIVGDAGAAWLRFEANSNIVSQIISNRFESSDASSFGNYARPGGNTPRWWKPETEALTSFYINKQWRPGSNSSIAVLGHDKAHQVVYFHHEISF